MKFTNQEYKKLEKMREIWNSAYDKPPQNVTELAIELMKKNNCYLELDNNCCCQVFPLHTGVYFISNVAVRKEKQGKGLGTIFINKIHDKYRGIFLLKTRSSKKFWEHMGYKVIYKSKGRYTMAYVNQDINIL